MLERRVDAKAEHGWTPLHFAAGKGRKKVVKVLLDAGADVDAEIEGGLTPLHYAALGGSWIGC